MGNLLVAIVHSAAISDSRGCHFLLTKLLVTLPHLLKILVDGGYKQGLLDWAKAMFNYLLEVVQRNELHTFKIIPKRWIVERTFAWLGWRRRLSKDLEISPKSSEAFLYLASISILLRN